jgi:outer membrane protein
MKHRSIIVTVALLVFAATGLQAQNKSITLKEAIELGVTNSKSLKSNNAKIAEATAAIKEAEERKLPDASISGSYLYLPVKPTIDLKTSENGGAGGPKVSQAIYGTANVSLPLYAGGKIKYGIEAAKYLAEAAKLDAANDKEAVLLNIINAYSNLYKAHAAVSLVKENLSQSNQRVKDFRSLEANGLLARNELLKAEVQSSNVELTLLDAESNYKLACVNMNLMLGLPEQTVLIPNVSSLQQPTALKSIDEYEQTALQNRPDLAALGFRKKAADVGIKTVKSDQYPSIALTGGYVAADIPKFFSVYNAVNIGVGIKYNISSLWKNKSKIEQANARAQQLSIGQEILNDNIRMQINQAYQGYLVNEKKIEVYKKAVEQANENYRITKNKYDNALSTTTELLDADVAQLVAKLNVANAQEDAVVAYNKLLQTAGLLTDKQ